MQINTTYASILRSLGLRATPARLALLKTLQASTQALTLKEIVAHTAVDQATVYRNLTPLLTAGVIEAITVSPKETRYALRHGHHDHCICTVCGLIVPVACTSPHEPNVDQFATITAHEVTYYGLCHSCA